MMKKNALEGFLKKHSDVSTIIAISNMELFVVLITSLQLLTNFTENPKIGPVGVVNAPLECYNVF